MQSNKLQLIKTISAKVPAFAWLAILASFGYATRAVVAHGGATHLSLAHLFVLQSLIAMPILAGMAKCQGVSLRPKLVGNRFNYLFRILSGIATTLFLMYALKLMPTALASTLSCTAPLFIAILAPLLLKEKTTPAILAVTTLGFIGVGIGAIPYLQYLSPAAMVVGLLSGVSGAFLQIYLRKVAATGEPGIRGVFSMHALSLVFGVVSCFMQHDTHFSKAELMVCFFTAVLSVVAQVSNSAAYAKGRALPVNALSFLTLPLSVILSAIFLGEHVPLTMLGSMCISMPACFGLVWLEQRHLQQIHNKKACLSENDIREEHAQEQHSLGAMSEPLFETEPTAEEYASPRFAKTIPIVDDEFGAPAATGYKPKGQLVNA